MRLPLFANFYEGLRERLDWRGRSVLAEDKHDWCAIGGATRAGSSKQANTRRPASAGTGHFEGDDYDDFQLDS